MSTAPAAPLTGSVTHLSGHGFASDYAQALLASLGSEVRQCSGTADDHPAIAWCRSGLMALTGRREGSPQMCPLPLASCADGVLAALAGISNRFMTKPGEGSRLLGVRAGIAGLTRNGAISPSGTCRLLPAHDGTLAVNLARNDDWLAVQAWLETERLPDWEVVAELVSEMKLSRLIERGRLLGLAVATALPPDNARNPWYRIIAMGVAGPLRSAREVPLVVDLSSLWAGPLCGQLLQRLGARVIKVESSQRPDGARAGPPLFYNLLNTGKASVRLDLSTTAGVDRLRRLIERADIVIESSRPRALQQLGIDAQALIAIRPGLTWISITGYGRQEPQAGWIAFGDDAGAAAGLSGLMHELTGDNLICGDAIGDPLTGLHAALIAWSSFRNGGGHLAALSLHDVIRHCIQFALPESIDVLRQRMESWQQLAIANGVADLAPPLMRTSTMARPLGADTTAIFAELGIPC